MYCVKFYSKSIAYGFIKPYNAVRDSETYSLTYMIPSMLDGIKHEHYLKGSIVRHKLMFDGMTKNDFKKCHVFNDVSEKSTCFAKVDKYPMNPHKRHSLINPTIILGFDSKEDAEQMATETIYVGQSEYMIYPMPFYDECQNIIVEMSDSEFSELPGVESFETTADDEDGFYCGNNRLNNNKRMYIKLDRKEWK